MEYIFSRWCKHAAETFIKVPFLGAVSYLTLAVSPFCITFAVVWAVYRNLSFGWIGQDILVRINVFCVLIFEFVLHKICSISSANVKKIPLGIVRP